MKKFLVTVMMFLVFAIGLPLSADAATCTCRRYRHRRAYAHRVVHYRTAAYVARRPSFYRRHRNMINIGIATGAGALVGGLLGGRRGVGLGILGGAGAGALYTYKLNPKRRRY
jgi:outer membrane lipoprotein SlyB